MYKKMRFLIIISIYAKTRRLFSGLVPVSFLVKRKLNFKSFKRN